MRKRLKPSGRNREAGFGARHESAVRSIRPSFEPLHNRKQGHEIDRYRSSSESRSKTSEKRQILAISPGNGFDLLGHAARALIDSPHASTSRAHLRMRATTSLRSILAGMSSSKSAYSRIVLT